MSNTAIAVHPDVKYVIARRIGGPDKVVVAEALWPRVLGEGLACARHGPGQRVARGRVHASVRDGRYSRRSPGGERHLRDHRGRDRPGAPGAGLRRRRPGGRARQRDAGRQPGAGGRAVRRGAAAGRRAVLQGRRPAADRGPGRARGLLFRSEPHVHSYPHCWRCGTTLLYYALPSWYIRTTAVKDQLLAENEKTNWQPPTIKDGRYGEWLRNNVDWALSRTRYWGTPLPVWECPSAHVTCVGSLAELGGLAGRDLSGLDPHRPFVDDVTFPCPSCGLDAVAGAGGDRRLVRLRVDAVRPMGCAAAERGRRSSRRTRLSSSARRSTRRGAGSTR